MDNFVVSFSNNSNTSQEIDIFESSNLTGGGVTENVYSWTKDWAVYGTGPQPVVYNTATGLWWDNTIISAPGEITFKFAKNDGTDFIVPVVGIATLINKSTAQLLAFFNTFPDLVGIGIWNITKISGSVFTFQVILNPTFASANNIAINNPVYNYGSGPFKLSGGTILPNVWRAGEVTPTLAQSSPALISNPNVSVVASNPNFNYSDFLWSTIGRTYDVKNFQLWSLSQNQLLQPFLFDRTLATGRVYQKVLTPTIDPYQSQNYIVTPDEKGYILDGFTKINYTLLPQQSIRLVLDYTFVDLSTPLIATLSRPEINQSSISPDFVDNMESGFDKFGCKFLQGRIVALNQKLEDVSGASGNMHPNWQEHIKSRLMYIEKLMISYDCITREEAEEMPEFKVVGPELTRTNLFMPSPEFVQSQLDDEQGVRKLFKNHDFPIEKE